MPEKNQGLSAVQRIQSLPHWCCTQTEIYTCVVQDIVYWILSPENTQLFVFECVLHDADHHSCHYLVRHFTPYKFPVTLKSLRYFLHLSNKSCHNITTWEFLPSQYSWSICIMNFLSFCLNFLNIISQYTVIVISIMYLLNQSLSLCFHLCLFFFLQIFCL